MTKLMTVLAVLVLASAGEAQERERDFRVTVSDLYYTYLPDARTEVDAVAALGADELWISYIHETAGFARIQTQLERAQQAWTSTGRRFRVVFGLGSATSGINLENAYINPYIDDFVRYRPRTAPGLGDFFDSTTGQDHPTLDIRTALKVRDSPGLIVAGAYWGTIAIVHEPRTAPQPIGPQAYRFRFPLRLEPPSRGGVLDPNAVVATLRVWSEHHGSTGGTHDRLVAERTIKVADFSKVSAFKNFDVFIDTETTSSIIDVEVTWDDRAAGLSVGVIEQTPWDSTGNRSMLEALDDDILRAGPNLKYGRNIFDYLTELHDHIQAVDPALFQFVGGFWMLDEPGNRSHESWRHVADTLERWFQGVEIPAGETAVPGFANVPVLTTLVGGPQDPNSRYHTRHLLEDMMAFRSPIATHQRYLLPPTFINNYGHSGPDYQASLDHDLEEWELHAESARAEGYVTQNFIDLQNHLTDSEVALQIYLSLALGYDRVAVWHIGNLINIYATTVILVPRGSFMRDLLGTIRLFKATYDRLRFTAAYVSNDLTGRRISAMTDATGTHAADLRIHVGEFLLGDHPYFLLVNRHTLATDTLDIDVTIDMSVGGEFRVVEAGTGQILKTISAADPTFRVTMAPGTGTLVGLVRPAIVSMVGDNDGFVPGHPADLPPRSEFVDDLIDAIVSDPGQGPSVDLDVGGSNRPVGWTHFFGIPPQALVTSAGVRVRFRSHEAAYNDVLLFDHSGTTAPYLPWIALRDLLGQEPVTGLTYTPTLNLAIVPIRTLDTTGGPAGHLAPWPDEHRNLLRLLNDGQFNLVAVDDCHIDFSELTLTWTVPTAPQGDLNADGILNLEDLMILLTGRNGQAYAGDPRDLDNDGWITVLDIRRLVIDPNYVR